MDQSYKTLSSLTYALLIQIPKPKVETIYTKTASSNKIKQCFCTSNLKNEGLIVLSIFYLQDNEALYDTAINLLLLVQDLFRIFLLLILLVHLFR